MIAVRWPMIALGEVLTQAPEPYAVDPERSYPNVGIYSFARGIFEKPPIEGRSTSATTLFKIRTGQFIYSRLFAFEGAYGVVPDQFNGYYVSNEFPTFDCDLSRVIPTYLKWYFSRPQCWTELAAMSTGLGNRRQRIHPDRLLEYRVPLPPIEEQRRLVTQLDAVAAGIEGRNQAVNAIELELNAALLATFQKITAGAPCIPMGNVAPLVRRPVDIDLESVYPELGVRSFGKGTFHKPPLTSVEVGTKRLFRIEKGDLLFNIVFAWEGAVAVAKDEDHGRFGSHRFLSCVPDSNRATSEFLRYFFLTDKGLELLGSASPGGAGRNRTLGLEALKAIEVPIPSLEAQQWFDALQVKAALARTRSAEAAKEISHLIPAMLNEIFVRV